MSRASARCCGYPLYAAGAFELFEAHAKALAESLSPYPELVVHDEAGKPYSVRYDAVNAMLLNESLKEHRRVEEQQASITQLKSNAAKQDGTISELKKDVGVLTAQVKEQAAQIQKVSAQLEASKSAPQVVNNP